jgi:hypothetical protein
MDILCLLSNRMMNEGRTKEDYSFDKERAKDWNGKRDKILNLELRKKNLELGFFRYLSSSRFRYFSLHSFLDFLYENFMRRVKRRVD